MINENNKNSWCVNAFHGMSANNDGTTKMCCMIAESYVYFHPRIDRYVIGKTSIEENFNNIFAEQIRSNLNQGIRDAACKHCWEEEDGGRKSKRLRDNEKYLHELTYGSSKPYNGLSKLELNLGNTCNIKCRTCHPTISSQWMKEDYDLNHATRKTYKEYSANLKRFHQQYDEDSSFWKDLETHLSTIKQFDFYGGEPFLSKKLWDILRICVDRDYAKDIELHYNTNGTTWPEETDLWKHFKSVNLSFSIDGVEDKFEYMRFPASWNEVCVNMEKAVAFRKEYQQLSLSWCVTLSSLNIYYLPEILDAYYARFTEFGLYLNLVHGPRHFNMGIIPQPIKDKIVERLANIPRDYEQAWYQLPGIIGFLQNGNHDVEHWDIFKTLVEKHDEYRKQDFYQTFYDYGKLVKET